MAKKEFILIELKRPVKCFVTGEVLKANRVYVGNITAWTDMKTGRKSNRGVLVKYEEKYWFVPAIYIADYRIFRPSFL